VDRNEKTPGNIAIALWTWVGANPPPLSLFQDSSGHFDDVSQKGNSRAAIVE
jgi:hypothetical protein